MTSAQAPPSQTTNGASQFVSLISDPFQSEIQSNSIYAALLWSFGVSTLFFIGFCLLRPRTNTVYAPRAKYADEKHAPPPLSKRMFSWFEPIKNVKEDELVEKIGLDAVVFLRFLRMTRNIFLVLAVIGCIVLIPLNLVGTHSAANSYGQVATLMKFTPQYILGIKFWAFVVCAYVFDIIICGFLWWNYRAVLRLRRAYFESYDYRSSLHARTLLLTHIPPSSRTDDGIIRLVEEVKVTGDVPVAAIARNVKELPELIEEHDEAVHELEKYLAKYLSNPVKLPEKRPICKMSQKEKGYTKDRKVDAIDYWTSRIRGLETEIKHVRETIDKRNPMAYGFASFAAIEDAHSVAYAARTKKPQGSVIRLAPKPSDLLWRNLRMTRATRRNRIFWDTFWMVALTVAYIAPNILTAVFLSDLGNLGLVWPAFKRNLLRYPTWWGIAQGIIAPAVQNLIYLVLPTIFRRLLNHSGDISKTSRERHVTSRLYAFFVFNNLIVFSIFASAWAYAAAVVAASKKGGNAWQAIQEGQLLTKLMYGLCNVSPFWLTWQMQRNLSAAMDLIQLWPLIWGTFLRKLTSPTPRQLIQLSAPQPFEYAGYYNNYLYVATVGLCFGTLQPLVLPITAFYMGLDAWWKKYLLQYVLITKTESGGVFWRPVINRFLFATLLGNVVVALLVGANGFSAAMLYCMIPLPILLAAFKWYLGYTFDSQIAFYTTRSLSDLENSPNIQTKPRRNDRVAVRFGHPALHRKLATPMVGAKSEHLLKEVYRGRLADQDQETHHGAARRPGLGALSYSDVCMSHMSRERAGKEVVVVEAAEAPFEIVAESEMDFENFKKRQEFRDEYGGDGELYGRPEEQIGSSRPGTPSLWSSAASLRGGKGVRSRSESPSARGGAGGTMYAKGYHATPTAGLKGESPSASPTREASLDVAGQGREYGYEDEEVQLGKGALLGHAAGMGRILTPGIAPTPGEGGSELGSRAGTPMDEDDTGHDYFRRRG